MKILVGRFYETVALWAESLNIVNGFVRTFLYNRVCIVYVLHSPHTIADYAEWQSITKTDTKLHPKKFLVVVRLIIISVTIML